jgi:copper resistance protein D
MDRIFHARLPIPGRRVRCSDAERCLQRIPPLRSSSGGPVRTVYLLNVTLHVFAAVLWLGGMFFFAVVAAPLLRGVEPPPLRARLFQAAGSRFRVVGWSCIAVLIVTGVLNLWFRGILNGSALASRSFWSSPYGATLAVKLVVVALMVTVSALHDFVHGPAASRLTPGSPEAARARRRAAAWARLNAVLGLIVLLVAVRLARGG